MELQPEDRFVSPFPLTWAEYLAELLLVDILKDLLAGKASTAENSTGWFVVDRPSDMVWEFALELLAVRSC